MKYDFDKIYNRLDAPYQYSSKWADTQSNRDRYNYGKPLPDDRIPLHTADMDFACAPKIIEAMVKTAEHGIYGYTMIPDAYYEAVAGWFDRRFDWKFDRKDIYVCMNGTHTAVRNCIESFSKPGDGVILMLPSYGYRSDIEPLGRHEVDIMLKEDNGWYTVDYDALEEVCKVEENTILIMIQPHNPTGRNWTTEELNRIADICRRNGVIIVSDEVHIDLYRKGMRPEPMMKACGPEGIVSTTAVNKTFNMAGMAMTNVIISDPELKAKYHFRGSSTPFGVSCVIAAYNECEDWVDELNEYIDMLMEYAVDRINKELPKAKVIIPEGTYTIWIDFRGYGLPAEEVNRRINDAHVMLKMGTVFDDPDGDNWARVCLSSPKSMIVEALDRIVKNFEDVNG